MKTRVLFHLHTNLTDGTSTVRDYFEFAKRNGIEKLVFLEHIRKNPTFDVREFAAEVARCSQEYGVNGIVGFEAKILPHGELDIQEEHIALAKYVGIAEHSFLGDAGMLVDSFWKICKRFPSKYSQVCFVWVHPGAWFKKRNALSDPNYTAMINIALEFPVLIEQNLRYQLPEEEFLFTVPKTKVIVGLDAHSVADLQRALCAEKKTKRGGALE